MNLMQIGLQSQKQAFEAANAVYTRIVRADELLADVHFEAQMRGCHLWADSEMRKAVICRNRPNGNYVKVNACAGRVQMAFNHDEGPAAA